MISAKNEWKIQEVTSGAGFIASESLVNRQR